MHLPSSQSQHVAFWVARQPWHHASLMRWRTGNTVHCLLKEYYSSPQRENTKKQKNMKWSWKWSVCWCRCAPLHVRTWSVLSSKQICIQTCILPHDITFLGSDNSLFITTCWVLLSRNDWIQLIISPLIPYCSALCISLWWVTLSNAFLKSKYTQSIVPPSSIIFVHWFYSFTYYTC